MKPVKRGIFHPRHFLVCLGLTIVLSMWNIGGAGTLNAAGSCTAPSFGPLASSPVGSHAFAVAVGDFNRDGFLDMAVTNAGDPGTGNGGGLMIKLGHGDGTFPTNINYAAANFPSLKGPSGIAVGDFNRDGKVDLAVTEQNSGKVSILLGDGDGFFQTPVDYTTGDAPISVAVGDFNSDGKADLVVANMTDISILLGNGDGTFQPAVSYSAGLRPTSVAVADLNSDGKADLAVANSGNPLAGQNGNLSILLGNGNGTFQAAVNYDSGAHPASVAIGDVNGDGIPDLAAVDNATGLILLGKGDGTFQTAMSYGTGANPFAVALADFNGDGKLDLAMANYMSNNVSIMLGAGDGTFQTAVNFGAGTGPRFVATGDFNGDGKADLVFADSSSGAVSIILNTCDSSCSLPNFGVTTFLLPAASNVTFPAAADFNGDGKIDLALINAGKVSILLGNGNGTFQSPVDYDVGTNPVFLAVGDLNGDGKADLVVVNGNSSNVSVLLGNGNGTFQPAVNYPVGSYPQSVAIADFNGDGKADLAVANNSSSSISILIGIGDGTFAVKVDTPVPSYPRNLVVGDFNKDGKLDLAVTSSDYVTILLGLGNGNFQSGVNYPAGYSSTAISMGDFDGDGNIDLAVTRYYNSSVGILLGNGDGSFQSVINYSVGSYPNSIIVGDFNRDGKQDLAVVNTASYTQFSPGLSILQGYGNGSFREAVNYFVGPSPQAVALADFNGDGQLDLVVTNSGSVNGSVSVLTGSCGSACPTISLGPTTLPDGLLNSNYSQTFTASGGVPFYKFAVTSGALPTWATLSAAGSLTGYPYTVATSSFTVTGIDANGCSGTRAFTLRTSGSPTVTTGLATNQTPGSVALNGTVNPNGEPTLGWFEWGTDSTLLIYNSTPEQTLGDGAAILNVGADLLGLAPSTNYYFRVVGSNSRGTTKGTIKSFSTPCTGFSISLWSQSFSTAGGSGSIGVTAPGSCAWSVVANDYWITITSSLNGSGNGTVNYSAGSSFSTSTRSGSITIGGVTFIVLQGAYFYDVSTTHPFFEYIGKLSARGITAGCGGYYYCPDAAVTREQMGIFIERAMGMNTPPTPTQQTFEDVPTTWFSYPFIEDFATRGITAGCSMTPRLFCPASTVTREQMGIFIERALGVNTPPTPTQQTFEDVPTTWFSYPFIEDFATRGITAGCSVTPRLYCPASPVTRGQMAVFLSRAFGL
ncbi:MAG: FG-GAP-like repeat-containing protein [Acidobacteriia bacterium]|nr:FG-GAP-like repeat-containing protein [Terriglobia bacterium]